MKEREGLGPPSCPSWMSGGGKRSANGAGLDENALEHGVEGLGIRRGRQGNVPGDEPAANQLEERSVEVHHALLAARLEGLGDVFFLAEFDQFGDVGGDEHYLDCRHPPHPRLDRGQEFLADDGLEVEL